MTVSMGKNRMRDTLLNAGWRLGVGAVLGLTGLFAPSAFAISYSAPRTITSGGVYTGNYQSLDRTVPAIEISTSPGADVVIENCNLSGAGDLIRVWSETKVTVRNCNGIGLGTDPGKFIGTANLKSLTLTNNYMENVSKGALVYEFHGSGTAAETI